MRHPEPGSLHGGLSMPAAALALAMIWPATPAGSTGAEPPPLAARSADGRWVLQAQRDPDCLWVLDAQQQHRAVRAIVPASRDGRTAGAAALRVAPKRRSFVIAPRGLPELWELSYDPRAEEIYDGIVHDYRFGEGVPRPGFFGLRRIVLPSPLESFVFDEHEAEAWGLTPAPPRGSGQGLVINLDVRRHVATVPASAIPAGPPASPVVAGLEGLPPHRGPCRV